MSLKLKSDFYTTELKGNVGREIRRAAGNAFSIVTPGQHQK